MGDMPSNSVVVPLRAYLVRANMTVDRAREEGYVCLSPLERAVAIDFAVTGHTLKQIAQDLQQPISEVRRAFNDQIVRAFICDLQNEIAQHKIVNAQWVETQILALWPQFIGEEEVNMVNKSGEQISAKKFHSPEVSSILKHFGGNADQKKTGGVNVQINFGAMGVSPPPQVNIVEREE